MKPAAPARAMQSLAICASWRARSCSPLRNLLRADESTSSLMSFQQSTEFEFAVGAHYCVGINRQVHGKLANSGQLIADGERSRGDAATDLIDDLAIYRHAALQVETKAKWRSGGNSSESMYYNTSTLCQ